MSRRALLLLLAWSTGACGHDEKLVVGSDAASGVEACLECHGQKRDSWSKLSSHSLLFDCATCHSPLIDPPGAGHAQIPACDRCHSESPHPTGKPCAGCHDPHGSNNSFLVRTSLVLADGTSASVHLGAPEGASKDGLVHAGVEGATAGSGVCEVCHTQTAYFTANGDGATHFTAWCPECHQHAAGFAPPSAQ